MANVPDHLVPTDGLTNSRIRFGGFDTHKDGGGGTMRFDIYDEEDSYVGTLKIEAFPTESDTVDAMIGNAYEMLTNILRQWLYAADKARQVYAKREVK